MNARHDNQNATPRLRWSRWGGPGLAILVLAGAGSYALFTRLAPTSGELPAAGESGTPSTPGARATNAARGTATGARSAPVSPAASAASASSPGNTVPSLATASPTTEVAAGQEPTMAQRREAVRQAANKFRHGRFNAFFREEKFLEEFAHGGPAQLAALKEELTDPTPLAELPAGTSFMHGKPEAVLERMSMIDMLHSLAPKDASARDTMVALLMEPVDSSLSDTAKKGLVGEKFDLLFRLAQLDRQLAVDSYAQLDNPKLKSLLREALLAGLSESGASMDEVKQLTRHL
ncbi:hypothetical protein D187_004483 [Cystobacter fuscus DSM 2262]|uniref:Uncharacterized protein n=1 Tax=Cystobacter fuscus (strain ATCC 25194 / DSM 2262 / NBRC 100088 / M29) TaxID=1242864 RepID=S9Q9C4_CYSF2|nr:hypothetical protein [Cystobacter fuscus]EPX57949.1 hypothetical protein D187_004483 [Cystobacter fuscus DSM 2262]